MTRIANRLPTLRLFTRDQAEIEVLARAVGAAFSVELRQCRSQIGSGALPLDTIASAGLVIHSHSGGRALYKVAAALRGLDRQLIGRIVDVGLALDLRCLISEQAFLFTLSGLNADALP